MLNYGSFIKERRTLLNISQKQIADALICSVQAVSKFENGSVSINLNYLDPLCKLLKIDINDFVFLNQNKDLFTETKTFNANHFSIFLKRLRKENHLTQNELAEKINISPKRISKWETNETFPTIEEFIILANFYKMTPRNLYYEDLESNDEYIKKNKNNKRTFIAMLIPLSVTFTIFVALAILSPFILDKTIKGKTSYHTVIFEYYYGNKLADSKSYTVKDGTLLSEPLYDNKEYQVDNYLLNETTTFDFSRKISEDMTIKANLSKRSYTVKFYGSNDEVIDIQNIEYGHSACPPNTGQENNFNITWDKEFSNVQENLDIHAIFNAKEKKTFTVLISYNFNNSVVDQKSFHVIEGEIFKTPLFVSENFEIEKYVLARDYSIFSFDAPITGNVSIIAILKEK